MKKRNDKAELEELKRQKAELKQELEKARLENENNRMREEIDLLRKGNLPSPGYPYGGGPIFGKKEKEIRKQIEAMQRLEQEKLNEKPFRIFTSSENGVTITEGKGKKIRVIGDYVFTGYNIYGQAVFDQVAQYIPKD